MQGWSCGWKLLALKVRMAMGPDVRLCGGVRRQVGAEGDRWRQNCGRSECRMIMHGSEFEPQNCKL